MPKKINLRKTNNDTISGDTIIEDRETNDLIVIPAKLPATVQKLAVFVRDKTTVLKVIKIALKSGQLPVDKFEKLLLQGQELGDKILDAKVELGNILISAPSAQGKRNDLIPDENEVTQNNNFISVGNEVKSKKEAYLKLNLNNTQSYHYKLLATYSGIVREVKEEAREKKDIPTEYTALKKIDELKKKKPQKAASNIHWGTSESEERLKKAYEKTSEEIEILKNNETDWEAVKLNPPTIIPMDCISFFDWCPYYDLMITVPSYQDTGLIISSRYEWVKEWVYTSLLKMKPTGSAYIAISGLPDELRIYLNAPIPEGVRLEDVLIWTQDGNFDYSKNNYKRNYIYKILYYRGKDSGALNEPVTIANVVNERNKENNENRGLYIIQSSNEGDIVVDPFCGDIGGLYMASKLGRRAYGAIYEDLEDDNAINKSKILQLLTRGNCELGSFENK